MNPSLKPDALYQVYRSMSNKTPVFFGIRGFLQLFFEEIKINNLYVFQVWCLLDAETSASYGLRERVFERFCGCSFDRLQGMGIQVTGDTDGRMPKVRGYSLDASPFGNQQSSIRVS